MVKKAISGRRRKSTATTREVLQSALRSYETRAQTLDLEIKGMTRRREALVSGRLRGGQYREKTDILSEYFLSKRIQKLKMDLAIVRQKINSFSKWYPE